MLVQYKTDCIRQILGVTSITIHEGNIRFVLTPELYEDIDFQDIYVQTEDTDTEVYVSRTDGSIYRLCKCDKNGPVTLFTERDEICYGFGGDVVFKKNTKSIHIEEIRETAPTIELLESRMQARRYSGVGGKVDKILSGKDYRGYLSRKVKYTDRF